MADLNAKKYPLTVARDIQRLLQIMRVLLNKHSNIIEAINNDYIFYLHDISHKDFMFYIGEPSYDEGTKRNIFPITYIPENEDSLGYTNYFCTIEEIEKHFNDWIFLINEYNNVHFTEEEIFTQFYEEELFSDFEIIDEDADIKPFDTNQQIILYKFLEATVNHLEKEYPNNEIVDEIIHEANSLKDEIPSLTKRIASKRFSQVLAKIRKFNPITFKDVYDVAKKEVIKYLLLKGVETLPKLVNTITHFLGS